MIGLLLYVFYKRPDLMGRHCPRVMRRARRAYPWFLMNELPTVFSGISIVGFFAIAQGSMDSAINALASSAVADIYYPLRASGRSVAARTARAEAGRCARWEFACRCSGSVRFPYDPNNRTLIDFALGVLAFAFTGMLGVFLTALLTRRGTYVQRLVAR